MEVLAWRLGRVVGCGASGWVCGGETHVPESGPFGKLRAGDGTPCCSGREAMSLGGASFSRISATGARSPKRGSAMTSSTGWASWSSGLTSLVLGRLLPAIWRP